MKNHKSTFKELMLFRWGSKIPTFNFIYSSGKLNSTLDL